jgi:hypothetical protein
MIFFGVPGRAINLRKALKKLLVSIESNTSRWMAPVIRQQNRQPYRLTSDLPFLTAKFPKQSIPTTVKGSPGLIRKGGRSAIFWSTGASKRVCKPCNQNALSLQENEYALPKIFHECG